MSHSVNLLLIGLLTVIFIVYLSSLNWRRAVKAVLVILVIEGALRKWVLPQASDAIYFLKDLVLLGAYLKYFIFSASERKYPLKSEVVTLLIFMATGWCVFQAFNPSLGSPLVGVFGLKAYLFNVPLMWMLPNLFQSEEELYKFLRLYLLLVIPVGLLGTAQFFSPPSSPINVYASGVASGDVATFGANSIVRVTGTFSYLSGYSFYLIVCFGLLIPILSIKQSWWWRWVSIVEILLVIVNSMMTGSRTSVIASSLFLLGYLGIQVFIRPGSSLNLLGKFLVPVIVVSLIASIWFRPAIDAFWDRTTGNQDVPNRISYTLLEPLEFIKYKELDGYGTGATHPGSIALRRALGLPGGEFVPPSEAEMGKIALELGPIGFVLWYGLRVCMAIALFLVFWKLKRSLLRQLALAAFLLQAIQINSHLVFHHTFSVYYWFLGGFIFLLPRLEQIENWHQEQQLQQDVSYTYLADSSYE